VRVRRSACAVVGALGLVAALAGCREAEPPAERPAGSPAIPVRVHTVRPETVPLEAVVPGTVRARTTTVITSTLQGYVAEVRVREGSRVAAGDLLVRLDEAEVAAQVAQAEAARQAAVATRDEAVQALGEARVRAAEADAVLAETRSGLEGRRQAVAEAEAAQAAAESQATLARATLGRYRQMFEERALSQQEFDEVVARARTAEAEAARARARLDGSRVALEQHGSRVTGTARAVEAARLRTEGLARRVGGAEARIREAEAEARRARARLGYARITAPGPGVVVEKTVEVGELATPGRVLLRLDDPSAYRLEVPLPSAEVARMRVGQSVEARVDDLGDRPLPGRVAEILPQADPATRTVTVKVDLPPAPGLRSGLYGTARVEVGRAERLHVPAGAVVERGQLNGVYVVDRAGVARWRLVTLGSRRDDRIEVLSGLVVGDAVVVDGVPRIAEGTRVEVRP
jgi:multidrug efflux pump subunit AcrA (membrane-fusion protein)